MNQEQYTPQSKEQYEADLAEKAAEAEDQEVLKELAELLRKNGKGKGFSFEQREEMAKNLRRRILAAHAEMDKIKALKVQSDKDKSALKYLQHRDNELNVSYRLAFNINWVIERTARDIMVFRKNIRREKNEATKARLISSLARLWRNIKCKKCNGTGHKGIKLSTLEFNICPCIKESINLYY